MKQLQGTCKVTKRVCNSTQNCEPPHGGNGWTKLFQVYAVIGVEQYTPKHAHAAMKNYIETYCSI